MIYEMRTFDLRPGMVPEFEKRYAAALPERTKISPLGALWHTEIGPLNQVIAVWPYADMAERERARGEAAGTGTWPPEVQDLIAREQAWILNPAPFMRSLPTGELGNIYEMRLYTAQLGKISDVIRVWSPRVADREKLSPLVACWFTDLGPLSLWIHVWPYPDLNTRARVRADANKLENWPPPTREFLNRQENKILVPAESSPLH
jgi:NIPSNAP